MQIPAVHAILGLPHLFSHARPGGNKQVSSSMWWVLCAAHHRKSAAGEGLPDPGSDSNLAAALQCADNVVAPAAALMYRSSEQGSTLFERLVAALEEHAEGRVIYLTGVHAA